MNSYELAGGARSPESNADYLQEKVEVLEVSTQKRVSLSDSVDTSLFSLPEHAQDYLREKCNSSQHLSLAAHDATKLLIADPLILDDPDFAEFELDTCIESTEIAALDEKIEEGNTTNEVLTKLNEVAREEFEKGGSIDAKLNRIEAQVEKFDNAEIALKQITQFRKTLADLRGVIEDPQEQARLTLTPCSLLY